MSAQRLGLASVFALGLAASTASAEVHLVEQTARGFFPADIKVHPGDTIEWRWTSGSHAMSSGAHCEADGVYFGNLRLDADRRVATLAVPDDGTTVIPYFSIPECHSGMAGTIIIESSAGLSAVSGWKFLPLACAVLAGCTILQQGRALRAARVDRRRISWT